MLQNLFFHYFPVTFFLLFYFLFFKNNGGICEARGEKLTVSIEGKIRASDIRTMFRGDPLKKRSVSVVYTGSLPGRAEDGNTVKASKSNTEWDDVGNGLIFFSGTVTFQRDNDMERRLAYALLRSARNAGQHGALISEWGPPVSGASYALYIGVEKIAEPRSVEITAETVLGAGSKAVTINVGTVFFESQLEYYNDGGTSSPYQNQDWLQQQQQSYQSGAYEEENNNTGGGYYIGTVDKK